MTLIHLIFLLLTFEALLQKEGQESLDICIGQPNLYILIFKKDLSKSSHLEELSTEELQKTSQMVNFVTFLPVQGVQCMLWKLFPNSEGNQV